MQWLKARIKRQNISCKETLHMDATKYKRARDMKYKFETTKPININI